MRSKKLSIKSGKVRAFTQLDINTYWEEGNDAWVINFSTGKEIPLTTVRRWIKSEGGFIFKGVAYTSSSSCLFPENR